MASKLIVIHQQLTSALHAALQVFAGETSPVLGERIAPFLGDEAPGFDFEALQQALARMIAGSLDRLVAADKAHLDELTGDAAPRRERDRRVQAVRAKLIDVRRIAAGLFGLARAREIVAVDGATAEQPELLWRQAGDTMSRLRDPELSLPPASTGAVTFNASALADELEPLVTALRESIDGCELDVRQAAVTLEVKKEAMAEHDRLTSACGKILSGLCLLADRPDLARRVRVTPPRSRRSQRSREDDRRTSSDAAVEPSLSASVLGAGGDLAGSFQRRHVELVLRSAHAPLVSNQVLNAEELDRDVSIRRRNALLPGLVEAEAEHTGPRAPRPRGNVPQGRITRTTDL